MSPSSKRIEFQSARELVPASRSLVAWSVVSGTNKYGWSYKRAVAEDNRALEPGLDVSNA